jgi:DNA primase
MFPISDIRGRVIGFGGRTLDDNTQPKYLNSPQTHLFDKSSTLYGIHLAKESMRSKEQAVIVEGYMDVIMPHQYGYKNVIASMGTAIGENHIEILKKITKNIILALDSDSAGETATLRSVWLENALGAEMRVAILPDGKDPDEIIIEDQANWHKLITTAIPAIDYTFGKNLEGMDLTTAHGKSVAVDKLMPIINQIANPIRQTFYLAKLATLVRQNPKNLELLLAKNRDSKNTKIATTKSREITTSSPLEEYCLSIILQHPELKEYSSELSPDFFDNSENREIYNAIINNEDFSQIKPSLDRALWEYYERLVGRKILSDRLDLKLKEMVLRMREEHLKRLAQNRADTLAICEGTQLREVFTKKEYLNEQKRRQK